MENVLFENMVVIKKVKENKEELERFKLGKSEINVADNNLNDECLKVKEDIEKEKKHLNALLLEKEDLQTLITRGNSGLINKVFDTQKKIKDKEVHIKELEERVIEIEELKKEQIMFLENALYNNYIDNGLLVSEFRNNAEALQLQYYSFLYKAFEIANKLKDLEYEYYNEVNGSFRNAKPYKGFTETFNYLPFINRVKNNFPNPTSHKNCYSDKEINMFKYKFDKVIDNKEYVLYK